MRRALTAALVAGLLVPGAVEAGALFERRVTLLVMYERDAPAAIITVLNARAGGTVTGTIPEVAVQEVVAPMGAAEMYGSSPYVRVVQRQRTFRLLGTPNDPLVKLQWGLRAVDAFKAWRIEDGKKSGVTVGVIDSGVDATHVDLKNRIESGFDFLEIDDDPYDDNGHGTHVSGIIVANVSNHRGIAGLAPGVSVIPMKACLAAGSCDPFAMWAGVIDATRRGADVLNLSIGGAGECDDISQAVFDWVHDQGTLTVAAAGNSGSKKDGNPTIAPANCDRTLGVGAIDDRGQRAIFSSYGDFVDIAAPGEDIWSTFPPIASLTSAHLGYASLSGTSMAAPHVAAAAALVKARHPEWSPAQIQAKLISSAVDAGARGRDDQYGEGILNLYTALR